mmetsp:Transcript_40700/g.62114  ORF Transcript_40700/g.62114 Transcript_40700/m.62114 type:complete len:206 (-) Transcript_40700:176-793(-)
MVGDGTHLGVLLDGDEDIVGEDEDNGHGDHHQSAHESPSVVENSAHPSHLSSVGVAELSVLACAVTLADESLQGAVEPLHDGEGEHVDEHVAHTYSGDEGRAVGVPDVVGVDELDEHIENHAHDGAYRDLAHDPELMEDILGVHLLVTGSGLVFEVDVIKLAFVLDCRVQLLHELTVLSHGVHALFMLGRAAFAGHFHRELVLLA